MIVRLGMAPRRDGLSFTDFQEHWRTSHADVVSLLPGLRRYQQFHAVLQDGRPLLDYPGFDACSALRFDSLEQMDAAFAAPHFLQAVQADEQEFVDKARFQGAVGRWVPDADAELGELGPVQVLTLLVAESGALPAELAARLAGAGDPGAALAAGSIVVDAAAHEGRFPAAADVVRVVGYPNVASALAGAALTRSAAGAAQVVGEHLAHAVDVPIRAADLTPTEGVGA